jgi:hypothetical protein
VVAGPVAAPSAEPEWWEKPHREPAGPAKPIVTVVGGVVAGLGALTMFAASVTWLTAWTKSLDVDEENCPGHQCVEGTRGGDAYEATKDLARATDILLGVGLPAIGGGLSMLIIGASMRGDETSSHARVTVRPTGAGASLEVTF